MNSVTQTIASRLYAVQCKAKNEYKNAVMKAKAKGIPTDAILPHPLGRVYDDARGWLRSIDAAFARREILALKQTGPVEVYVKKFLSIAKYLEYPDVHPVALFTNFRAGLDPYFRAFVDYIGAKTLTDATAAVHLLAKKLREKAHTKRKIEELKRSKGKNEKTVKFQKVNEANNVKKIKAYKVHVKIQKANNVKETEQAKVTKKVEKDEANNVKRAEMTQMAKKAEMAEKAKRSTTKN